MSKAAADQKSYKQLSEKLDGVLAWFDQDDIDLDEALAKYEQAIKLIAEMENYLKTAKNKVKKLSVDLQ